MKIQYLILFSLLLLAGCGSSNGPTSDLFGEGGNFTSTTADVQSHFLYVLNESDGSVSAYILPEAEEEDGHSHGHTHGRILGQEEQEEHEETVESRELEGSPFELSPNPTVGIAVAQSEYLLVLDSTGLVQTFRIGAVTGLLSYQTELAGFVSNPRKLVVSPDGDSIAILGDELSIHQVNANGVLSAPAFLTNTQDWVDVELNGDLAVASTAAGAVGFQWSPGVQPDPLFEQLLPGNTRGDLAYAESGVFVVNRADNSISHISQAPNGEIALDETFDVSSSLTEPSQIVSIFGGEDLGVASSDSFVLFHFHAEEAELEDEGTVALERPANSLFAIPESEYVLVGHPSGPGSTVIAIEEEGPEELHQVGPGGDAPSGFGFAELTGSVTAVSEL